MGEFGNNPGARRPDPFSSLRIVNFLGQMSTQSPDVRAAEKVYSNRLMFGYVKLMDQRAGKPATDEALARAGLDRLTLLDGAGFVTLEENDALVRAAIGVTGEQDIGYVTGRNLVNTIGNLQGFTFGITSPGFLLNGFGQIEEKLARRTVVKTVRLGKNRYRVEITFRDGFREKEYVCRNRLGAYESMPLFFGLPYAKVDHSECAFHGAEKCVYEIRFPDAEWGILNRVFQVSIPAALAFSITAAAGNHPWAWNAATAAFGAGLIAFSAYKHRSAKKSLEWTLITNEGLAKQNRILETTNQQIQSLQDLTTSLNERVNTQAICDQVVEILVQRFRFGSSQIWLLDEKGEYLGCASALGYAPELQAYIRATRFRMGEDWDNPYGLLVQTLEGKKTLLFNDPEEVYGRVSARTAEFLRALKMSSFIITPLLHEGKALGILAAEYHLGEKFQNQDRLLFQSISNTVAATLIHARLFEGMERMIEQRTRDLEAANQQLLAAKEMAIQSEKLSSLGQMAAGVAHEINNPLNFLVNIIPDVKRDLEALALIRGLALKAGVDPETLRGIREIEEKFDLEAHLEDKDFVFEKIQKALDKSTRIANSLKVFSRSSSKEKVAREGFGAMVRDVIELIPKKVMGDTRISLDIPDGMAWAVNKNEMEQAILVLVNNAIDAMGQKGALFISGIESPAEMLLAFKDEGPGIPEASIKRIFDPFFTTKPPGKGTGLGLTIASEIVKKYGGALSVQSEPGKGATFFMRFRKP